MHSSVVKDALHLLTLAGLVTPVKQTDGTGVPLAAEEDDSYVKYLFFDLGIMQTMLGIPSADILLASEVDFVNKGGTSEMHYWQNTAKGSNAEVDYLRVRGGIVLPVEVKASTQGAMQSLWIFMRKRWLHEAVRTSLEPFGEFAYADPEAKMAERHVEVVPLYALSNLRHTPEDYRFMISKSIQPQEKSNSIIGHRGRL